MRKYSVIAVLAIMALVWIATPAVAKPLEIEVTITSVTVALDKNGNQYVRFIAPVTQTTDKGSQVPVELPIMAFGPHVEQAKTMKAGQQLKVTVLSRYFQGRQSFTILKYNE